MSLIISPMTATIDVLQDIAQGVGPKISLLALGYAGWGPQGSWRPRSRQNGWLTCAADRRQVVFGTEDSDANWTAGAAALLGGVPVATCRRPPDTPRLLLGLPSGFGQDGDRTVRLDQSASPCMRPISRPSGPMISVAGRPKHAQTARQCLPRVGVQRQVVDPDLRQKDACIAGARGCGPWQW